MSTSKSIYFAEQLFVASSETREFKRMYQPPWYQIRKRDRLSLVFEKLLTLVNKGHHQTFLLNILEKYPFD